MQKNNKPRVDKVTVVYTRVPKKDPPKEGDRRMIKGVMHIRRHVTVMSLGERCYLMSRGKPVLEWVPEETRNKI